MTHLLLRNVEVSGVRRDVAIADGRISHIADRLDPHDHEVIDGHGGALLPGLHDHHIHLHATAAAMASVRCGPPAVTSPDALAAVLRNAPGDSWIRGVGYVETVASLLDSVALDRFEATRPVRIQHRSGAVWFLNSAAAAAVGLEQADHPGVERDDHGHPTGRVWRADSWLRDRLPDNGPPPLDAVAAELTRYGITGVTDATPDLDARTQSAIIEAHETGILPQRVHLLGVPIGQETTGPTVTTGPYKIVIADSALPELDSLTQTIRHAHDHGRPVAVHCVSRVALVLLLAAFDDAGTVTGDRIEHGAVIPDELISELADRQLTIVTQPGFIADRGDDYLDRVDAEDLPHLYRCQSLVDRSVPIALSSDAPYGPLDPWAVIAAAITRQSATGIAIGTNESMSPPTALNRYLAPLDDPGGEPRQVVVGAPADLVLLGCSLRTALSSPNARNIRCTTIRGHVHRLR
ncbi:amidohydrolase family protein [Gordonia sp. CPCC 205515]|uniref:amidohydrolase family protein n=1 Tax=Gordonia sp. CPCC 205515 TaxID=3140791 RepID=UPI003AF34655